MTTSYPPPTLVPPPSSGKGRFTPPQTIGKYRVVREVGTGGMAEVFLASREGPEGFAKPYVIKRILPQYSHDEQFARLFVTEAKIAALLDHPNIVHVFDFEIERGNYYLVMEYVAGASLLSIMRASVEKRVPLGPRVAVEIAAGVAQALAYAHDLTLPDGTRLDLVHRDISPGNVLVSRDGAVKLADFGVVKTAVTETPLGIITGKWAYMSPEQIGASSIDRRSDLFSLGIIVYELITGRRLFRGSSPADTATKVKTAVIPRPRTLIPDIEPRLDEIVMRLLERDPRTRYQNAAELAADLEELRATPAFVAGMSGLRNLVRTLFPEDTAAAALGTSLTPVPIPRPTPAYAHQRQTPSIDLPAIPTFGPKQDSGPLRETPAPAAVEAARDGISWKTLALVTAACLAVSALFWLIVLP